MRFRPAIMPLALCLVVPSLQSQAPAPATISAEQFASLRWYEGAWRGSGGRFPSFYEDFRWVDDSTVARRTFSDSTLTEVTERSAWVLRNGTMRNVRDTTTRSVVVRLRGDSLEFASVRDGSPVVFVRRSDDAWTAFLGPADNPRVTYEMRRYRP